MQSRGADGSMGRRAAAAEEGVTTGRDRPRRAAVTAEGGATGTLTARIGGRLQQPDLLRALLLPHGRTVYGTERRRREGDNRSATGGDEAEVEPRKWRWSRAATAAADGGARTVANRGRRADGRGNCGFPLPRGGSTRHGVD